jgi:CheY-specific phosphatase CheX
MNLAFERPSLEQGLTKAATEVLETMFFASVDEVPVWDGATEEDRVGAALEFHGACRGRLALSLDRNATLQLASSFFGDVEEDSAATCESVMAELTNMVCGAMLSKLDRNSIFCLDSPVPLAQGQEASGDIVKHLMIDDGLLRLAFSISDLEQR